jgi:hypothetical protein
MSSIPKSIRQQVISEAEHRCEYCLTSFFNPRKQLWIEHFAWINGVTQVIGVTASGRVTATALRINNEYIVATRSIWVARGWHPPY